MAEDKLQIMTMEVTFSSKQFYMDRDNTMEDNMYNLLTSTSKYVRK